MIVVLYLLILADILPADHERSVVERVVSTFLGRDCFVVQAQDVNRLERLPICTDQARFLHYLDLIARPSTQ